MAQRVTEKEIKTATSMASRKKGVTLAALSDKLGIKHTRGRIVLDHAMKVGAWSVDRKGGPGKDNRIKIYSCSTNGAAKKVAKPKAKATKKKAAKKVPAKKKAKAKAKK